MARVKRGVHAKKHHKAILEQAQGYYGNKSRSFRAANEQVMHSLQYAFRDRRARKGDFRQLWIQRINAAARANGMSYSRFVAGLRMAEVDVDRKVLADLAVAEPAAFAALVKVAEQGLAGAASAAAARPVTPAPLPAEPEALVLAPLSFRHAKVQRLRRLLARHGARDAEGVMVVEGATLLAEALGAGVGVESVYVGPAASDDAGAVALARSRGARVYDVSADVIARVASTASPQPVLAVVEGPSAELEDLRGADLLVVCVDVRDPGNLGTVLRSAEAAGAGGVVCCGTTVDLTNPKCVRASAGSVFHVPVVAGGDAAATLSQLGAWGVRRLGAAARAGVAYDEADLVSPTAFVLGNEAHGLPSGLDTALDGAVHIPMTGRSESLNVGMACAVLCFEATRQRRARELDR